MRWHTDKDSPGDDRICHTPPVEVRHVGGGLIRMPGYSIYPSDQGLDVDLFADDGEGNGDHVGTYHDVGEAQRHAASERENLEIVNVLSPDYLTFQDERNRLNNALDALHTALFRDRTVPAREDQEAYGLAIAKLNGIMLKLEMENEAQ